MLSHDILLALKEQILNRPDSSSIPAGYFDGLADSIMGKIKAGAADDTEGSALLSSLKGINVYQVPPGYFYSLATDLVNKLPHPAKVVIMEKRSSFFRYAVAAVITGIMGLSVISIFDKKQPTDSLPTANTSIAALTNVDEALLKVSDNDIVNYLKESGEDVNAALVASIADDKNLPDQVDYLTDEKTLDNLLNELKASESTNN